MSSCLPFCFLGSEFLYTTVVLDSSVYRYFSLCGVIIDSDKVEERTGREGKEEEREG